MSDIEALDDYICDAIMAARHGSYDGMPVLLHLERLLDRFRAAMPVHDAQVRAEALAPIAALADAEEMGRAMWKASGLDEHLIALAQIAASNAVRAAMEAKE